jgi:hypothetical protein
MLGALARRGLVAKVDRITQIEVRRSITVGIGYYALALPAAMLLPLVPAALLHREIGGAIGMGIGIALWIAGGFVLRRRRVVIDRDGFSYRGVLGTRHLAWDDVEEYGYEPARLVVRGAGTTITLRGLRPVDLGDVVAGVAPAITARVERELAATGRARFGDLELGGDGIRWGSERVPRAAIESVGVVDGDPAWFRVMGPGRTYPLLQVPLAWVPDALHVLPAADALGYRITR